MLNQLNIMRLRNHIAAGTATGGESDRQNLAGSFSDAVRQVKSSKHHAINFLTLVVVSLLILFGFEIILHPCWYSGLGVLMLSQAMIASAYLCHDCAHLSGFKGKRVNLAAGEILYCISGNAMFSFRDYRKSHLRHHTENIDLVGVDIKRLIDVLPRFMKALIIGLEFYYIPAIFFIVRLESMRQEFSSSRLRPLLAMIVFALFYCLIFLVNPLSLVLYFCSVILRIHCMRFIDSFQHTYERTESDEPARRRGWPYEQQNTFSFPVFERLKWLNVLILNFGYHNAHHAVPSCPWYKLPELDRLLSQISKSPKPERRKSYERKKLGIFSLTQAYHRSRVERILADSAGTALNRDGMIVLDSFTGILSDNLLG